MIYNVFFHKGTKTLALHIFPFQNILHLYLHIFVADRGLDTFPLPRLRTSPPLIGFLLLPQSLLDCMNDCLTDKIVQPDGKLHNPMVNYITQ